jgi:hypothetical protein
MQTTQSDPPRSSADLDARHSQGASVGNQGEINQHFGPQVNIAADAAGEALGRIVNLLLKPDALIHLSVIRDRLESANRFIRLLADCKKLHDHLHRLQLHCLSPIMLGAGGFPGQMLFVDNLPSYTEDFQTNVSGIRAVTTRLGWNAVELRWVMKLEQAGDKLNEALALLSKDSLDAATRVMRTEIGRRQEEANTRLKEAARSLLALHLADAVTQVRDRLTRQNLSADLLQQYDEGIAALAQFGHSLNAHIADHDGWQEVENILRLVEDDPEAKLAASWPDVMDVLQPLLNAVEEPDDDLMTRLRSTAAKLEAAVQAQQALPLRRAFFEFRSQAGRRFFVVDERLLALCNALLEIGPRLDNLLSVLPRTN